MKLRYYISYDVEGSESMAVLDTTDKSERLLGNYSISMLFL